MASSPEIHDPRHEFAHGIASALVRRPVTVFMLFLTLIGTGVITYLRIPVTFLPDGLADTTMTVFLPYPGAGPLEVQDRITRPVEETLRTIPGITEIVGYSQENASQVSVSLSSNVDMNDAYAEIRDRIERIRNTLPEEMDRYQIWHFDFSADIPIMWMGIQYDESADDPFGPLERIAVPRLESADGVARIEMQGVVDEAVRIFVDINKVSGYGVDLGALIQQMRNDNFTLPAGEIDDGGRTFALRIDARFKSVEEIRRYPVAEGLVLDDIADVIRGRAYRDSVWRINGQRAVGMSVNRESDENTVEVCSRVEELVAELQEDPRLEGYTFNIFWTQKDEILSAVGSMKSSALWGGLFAVIILFFFLRDVRMTLLAALAIPSSLLVGVMCVYFGGSTLNVISLAGFTLGIGMLVDNAVVIIESIARRRSQGMHRLEAASEGAGDVGLAVLTATLTSVVVFLPLAFMEGERNGRIMMREVGLPISYSLLASLLVALVFLPTFTSRLMRHRGHHGSDHNMTSGRLVRSYTSALPWILQHRFVSLLVLVGVVIVAQIAGSNLRAAQPQGEEGMGASIRVKLPSTYTLDDANGVFVGLDVWAESYAEEFQYDFWSSEFRRRGGDLHFWPSDDADTDAVDALADNLRSVLPEYPGVEFRVGRDQSGGSTQIRLDIWGPDFGVAESIAQDLRDELRALTVVEAGETKPLFENVETDVEDGLDEVHVSIDRDRSAELGVNPETVRGMVAWGLGGQRLPDLQLGDQEIRVQIEYAQSDSESLEFLRYMGLPTDRGTVVPLASVADLSFDMALGTLVRRNGRTSSGVTATPTIDNVYMVSREIQRVLANYPFPEGYAWEEGGGEEEFEADMSELFKTLGFSVLLVYLLMAILLESAAIPLSILISIPLALMGVNLTLFVTDRALDAMVVVGMILLAGIVVNNAIVLLDRVQRLRAHGLARGEALVRGGAERLRPILMTALTTIFGLMPMAMPKLFGADGSSGYESMAITVAGGLAFSTFFTLLAVPLFYTFFDDLGRILAGYSPWVRRPAAPAPAAVAAFGQAPAAPMSADGLPLAPRD